MPEGRRVPLVLKLAYSAFLAVLVPFYWQAYGPTNFLYFCDVVLFLTLAALWAEAPLPAGMGAVGILMPQLLWVADFLCGLVGREITGMTDYMFKESIHPFARGLSLFHGWIPFLLLYLVFRLGYDRRSLLAWTTLAWALMLVCYFLMPAPPPRPESPDLPVNINYVYGPSDAKAQEWMHPLAWLGLLMVGLPLAFYLPTHFLLCWLAPLRKEEGGG